MTYGVTAASKMPIKTILTVRYGFINSSLITYIERRLSFLSAKRTHKITNDNLRAL